MAKLLGSTGVGGAGGAVSPPPPPTVYLRDTFTDTDGTSLAAHTMDVGAGWTLAGGVIEIQTNSAQLRAGDNSATARADAGVGHADVTVTAVLTIATVGLGNPGLYLRGTGADDYWLVQITAASIDIYSVVAGAFALAAQTMHVYTVGTPYAITVTCTGATITATADGATVTYALATVGQTATLFGLRLARAALAGTPIADTFNVGP